VSSHCEFTDIVCGVQQFEQMSSSAGDGGGDPSLFAPPSCHQAVAKKLVEASGGTFHPATASQDEAVTSAAMAASMIPNLALCAAVLGIVALTL
jgi:hypothetical protein